MQVLVTGGLGYLGHAVVRQLISDGHHVTALTSRSGASSAVDGTDTVVADIRDRDALAGVLTDTRPDGICHLAALTRVRDSFDHPVAFFDVNVGGTVALLKAMADAGMSPTPIVYASTGAVYGPAEGRVSEDSATLPTNPYGASKLAAEQLLRYQAQTNAIGLTILRCFNIAGAVDGVRDTDTTRIIPKALAVAGGTADEITINGDGSAIREFTHVVDVASAIALAVRSTHPADVRIYNVGSSINASMLDIVATTESVTGRDIPVVHRAPRSEPSVLMADSQQIRQDLGWQPTKSDLETIIRDAWDAEPKADCPAFSPQTANEDWRTHEG